MEKPSTGQPEINDLQQAALKWLELKLGTIKRQLDESDPRREWFDWMNKYFDKISIAVNRYALNEKGYSLKFGLDKGYAEGEEGPLPGFVFPLTQEEAENLHKTMPGEIFKTLCLLGIERTFADYEYLNRPRYMDLDIRKLQALKSKFEMEPSDNPELKNSIRIFNSI